MSKVFDAFRRLEQESGGLPADFDLETQLVFQQQVSTPEAPPPSAEIHTATTERPHSANGHATSSTFGIRVLPIRLSADSPLIPFEKGQASAGEQYRIIRTKIVQHPISPRVMAVSSADPGDGKTVSSINAAAALALKSEVNVLLADADLRRGQIANLLGLPQAPGLTEVLMGTCSLEQAVIQVEQYPNLYVLTTGNRLANPTELLDSPQWRALAKEFRKQFDYSILDTPPIGRVADYDLIQAVSDGVLLVARPDYTNRSRCLNALETIPPGKLIGVILNCVEDWFLGKSSSYYSYIPASKDQLASGED
jgi:capsular exopolysaccharide synthesis family protein